MQPLVDAARVAAALRAEIPERVRDDPVREVDAARVAAALRAEIPERVRDDASLPRHAELVSASPDEVRPATECAPEWQVRAVAATGSTNADLLAAARDGAPAGTVLAADYQGAGRGRLGRAWVAPPGSMVAFSVLLRPRAPRERWTWLPLLAGLAVAGAIGPARLKWPNDVLLEDKKVCGILAEAADDAVVIGIGVNTAMTPGQLPVPTATSLAIAGLPHDPTALVAGILRELDKWYRLWEAGQDISAAYTRACATISRDVNVIVSESEQVAGRALRVDSQGCLVVATAEGERAFSAGDVVHVR